MPAGAGRKPNGSQELTYRKHRYGAPITESAYARNMSKKPGIAQPTTGHRLLSAVSLSQWIALGLTVIAIVFIVQNRNSVSVDLFWVSIQSPLWFILVIVLALGWVAGVLTGRGHSKRKAQRQ